MSTRLGQALHRLTASREELEAADERRTSHAPGSVAVADLVPRRRAAVSGVLTALTYRPRTQTPALVARLYDGTGTIDLIFLGRREVAGIELGRRLVAEGMVYDDDGRPAMYNPAYELAPRAAHA
ncbi:OB-fold nucleic acid binding domain-containing protein [Georgenia subflava]|uniref:DNA-binding protein n=1 Tax=Georgenia subflava TaxID=1622177 RepID=A0A6N7ER25_9MICO|nr:OB-fold nucleic acid binding domain-containing protein [Georgenia subflava]MPV38566.1 hypothetical protein [Georgenia subflava]